MSDQNRQSLAIVRRKEVESRTGLSRSAIYERIQSGDFPRPVNLGAKAVGWVEAEVEDWIAQRVAARDQVGSKRGAA